jgi:hypothetical protein
LLTLRNSFFDATAALAGIAVLQLFVFGWQGKQLKRTVEHLVISERAHVSGGANHATTSDGRKVLIVTINNHGKTQAFIGNVAATICKKEELTNFPGWEVNEWKGYVFGPAPNQRSDIVFEHEAGKVIVGRIWYRDVFKKCYSVGLSLILTTSRLSATMNPIGRNAKKKTFVQKAKPQNHGMSSPMTPSSPHLQSERGACRRAVDVDAGLQALRRSQPVTRLCSNAVPPTLPASTAPTATVPERAQVPERGRPVLSSDTLDCWLYGTRRAWSRPSSPE